MSVPSEIGTKTQSVNLESFELQSKAKGNKFWKRNRTLVCF